MQKVLSFLIFFLVVLIVRSQGLDGTYYALELNGLRVDTSGEINFYGSNSFPKEKWFHQIDVIIKGSTITVEKYSVNIDSTGAKTYSAADGGFLTYRGKVSKWGEVFIARTQLAHFDYIGFSVFEPPVIVAEADTSFFQRRGIHNPRPPLKELRQTHDVTRDANGMEVFLPKGTLRKDFVVRPAKEGLWINNVLYYRKGGKAGR